MESLESLRVSDTAMKGTSERASFWLLLLVLILLPLPKAGMMPGALSVFMVGMLMVLFLSLGRDYSRNNQLPWLLVWLVFAIMTLAHIFLAPSQIGLANLFPSTTVLESLELYRLSPVDALRGLNVLALFTSLWLVAWRVSWASLEQLRWIFLLVFVASLFQAVFGLAHFLSESTSVLGMWDKEYYLKDVTGTFVNRNHFSGMLAICWPLVLCSLIGSQPLLFPSAQYGLRLTIALLYSFVMVVALISSHSRMGTVAAFSGVFVCFVIYSRALKSGSSAAVSRIFPIVAFVFVLLFAVWFGVADILERYTALEGGDSRTKIWQAMFDLPFSAWLVGIGPGAFEDVFHLVQPDYLRVRFLYAHNDYLEFLLEFGLFASSLILIVFIYWSWKSFPRGNNVLRAGALGSITAVGLHSIVDFNLQIPGSALFFWVAVGLVMNPVMVSSQIEQDQPMSVRKSMRKRQWLDFFRS